MGTLLAAATPAQAGTDAVPGLQRLAMTNGPGSPSVADAWVYCRWPQNVTGVGVELLGARGQAGVTEYTHAERQWGIATAYGKGQVVLDDVVPSADLTNVRVEAFEDQDGTTNNWSVTAYAICANQ